MFKLFKLLMLPMQVMLSAAVWLWDRWRWRRSGRDQMTIKSKRTWRGQ